MRGENFLLAASGWRAAWLWGGVLVLALRLGLGLVMGAAWLAVRPSLPAGGADLAAYGSLPVYTAFPGDALLGVWLRWDAVHHLNLARLGYSNLSEGDSVFYPLYAGMVRGATWATGGDFVVGGLLISSLAAIAALACLYRLAEDVYGSPSARWTVLALGLYPTAFFLLAPFTESLFLALTLGAFVAAYRRRWWLAGVLGALGSLTRGPGMLTSAALAWIAWNEWRSAQASGATVTASSGRRCVPRTARRVIYAFAGIALPILGGLAFLAWRSWAGYAPISDSLRAYSGLELIDPVRGVSYAVAQFLVVHDLSTTLDVSSAALFVGLAAALAVNARWRRGEWLIYIAANLAMLLGKHSLVASSLQSLARYVLVLFPAFIVLGDWLAHRSARLRFGYFVLSGALLVVLSALYALWWFIG